MTPSKKIFSLQGEAMLSARAAAKRLSCAQDYVSKLCREGKLRGQQINGAWFVEESSIVKFEASRTNAKVLRKETLAAQRKEEARAYRIANGLPVQTGLSEEKSSTAKVAEGKTFSLPYIESGKIGFAVGAILLVSAVAFAGGVVRDQGVFGNAKNAAALG
ncbi:MAG TPA: hypothetical protein VD928_01400, partial [Candidatus Paceibacterota bacterium]|nr:hypothetical protein [Candidatus Paceibacterota bacterium]